MRLNANIPNEIYRKLKVKAAEDGATINDLVLEWVDCYLAKDAQRGYCIDCGKLQDMDDNEHIACECGAVTFWG